MKMGQKQVALFILLILAAGIGLAKLTGYWVTESTKQPVAIKEGAFAGLPNPADIRGSYAFSDVGKAFDIPNDALLRAFGLEGKDPATTKLKELEDLYANSEAEIGRASVQYFVTLWSDIPSPNTGVYLPESAVAVLKEADKLSPEEEKGLESFVLKISPADGTAQGAADSTAVAGAMDGTAIVGAATAATGSGTSKNESPAAVSGKTTFQQLLDLGLSRETVEAIVGSLPDTLGMTVKDYAIAQGLDFSAIKAKLLEALPSP